MQYYITNPDSELATAAMPSSGEWDLEIDEIIADEYLNVCNGDLLLLCESSRGFANELTPVIEAKIVRNEKGWRLTGHRWTNRKQW